MEHKEVEDLEEPEDASQEEVKEIPIEDVTQKGEKRKRENVFEGDIICISGTLSRPRYEYPHSY